MRLVLALHMIVGCATAQSTLEVSVNWSDVKARTQTAATIEVVSYSGVLN